MNVETTRILAYAAMKEGKYRKSFELFQSIVDYDGQDATAWLEMGRCILLDLATDIPEIQSTVEVAFYYFQLSRTHIVDQLHGKTLSSKEHSELVTDLDKQILSIAFYSLGKFRIASEKQMHVAENKKNSAGEDQLKAWGLMATSLLFSKHKVFVAINQEYAKSQQQSANSFYQEHQNNIQKAKIINDIIENLITTTKDFITNLNGSFSKSELEKFNFELLPPDQKEERKAAIEKAEKERTFSLEERWIKMALVHNQEYFDYKKKAEICFKDKKYKLAYKNALIAYQLYEDIKNKAMKNYGDTFQVEHKDSSLMDIGYTSRRKIRSRRKAYTVLFFTALVSILVFLYFHYFSPPENF